MALLGCSGLSLSLWPQRACTDHLSCYLSLLEIGKSLPMSLLPSILPDWLNIIYEGHRFPIIAIKGTSTTYYKNINVLLLI